MVEDRIPSCERKIKSLFWKIEDNLGDLRELISQRSALASSLCWLSFIKRTEKRLDALFDTAYKAEVSYQQQLVELAASHSHARDHEKGQKPCKF